MKFQRNASTGIKILCRYENLSIKYEVIFNPIFNEVLLLKPFNIIMKIFQCNNFKIHRAMGS